MHQKAEKKQSVKQVFKFHPAASFWLKDKKNRLNGTSDCLIVDLWDREAALMKP